MGDLLLGLLAPIERNNFMVSPFARSEQSAIAGGGALPEQNLVD
ncbi:hypothetical protein AB0B66_40545 [Catellatospora sp. NPDC049111]